ncbi:ROK family protein [Clostridium sp. BL-8]|uniref:ROK family protein n=1 Tax=Clostridium sp. BL-8 TaxID=349938 RepID=UPI00098C8BED|nr:ROK family protein [Clostridium sp. BL-8]OOM80085.1 glucokinase [Clostridium sp. BL-8]
MNKIGIDIGGTQLRVAIFDESEKIIKRVKFKNERDLGCVKNLSKLVDFINSEKENYEFLGIGIGCPGPLDIKKGKILNPPNLIGWNEFNIVEFFEKETFLKTKLNNDANVAGLAEALYGNGEGYESVFFITISTGIGGAYILNNKIIGGANSAAAEINNIIINEDKYSHNGLNYGGLEGQCSGTNIARIASEKLNENLNTKDVFKLYYLKDKLAVQIIENFCENIAKGIANICAVVDPDIFIIGGSVVIHNPQIISNIKEKTMPKVHNPQTLKIKVAKFEDDAGLIGASQLV